MYFLYLLLTIFV